MDLKEKYKDWVVVWVDGFRFLGKAHEISVEEEVEGVVLKPCYQVHHQVQMVQQQPNRPPGVGFMPILMPPDLSTTPDVPVSVDMEAGAAMRLRDLPEDVLENYDELIEGCNKSFEQKRQAMRSARSGVVPAAAMPDNIKNFDPTKFKA